MNKNQNTCTNCRKPKANYNCGICTDSICKSCAQFLPEDSFSFLNVIPEELTHTCYCSQCFVEKVDNPLADYNQKMEEAKEIYIFTKEQSKQTRLLQRKEAPYSVEDCQDEEEALMRMSFKAVQEGFNALIDLQFTTKKIIVGSHKKLVWSGTGVPITINPDKVSGY